MIEVEHLSKLYGSTSAIQDVTFAVEPGEILGFLGPNGAGKTTTMRILTGYLPATSGTAKVAGFDVHDDSMAVRQRIGYLPETPPLYADMTVEAFLNFVAQIKGVAAGDRPRQVESAMARCNITEKRRTLIRTLSKGFRQRVGIAQAIVHDPPVIILDEPTVGLDPRQIIDVRNLIKSLAGDHTIVLSTHILQEVSMTCSRVAIINRGQIVATNTPEELVAQLTGGSGYELEIEGNIDPIKPQLEALEGVRVVEVRQGDRVPGHRRDVWIGLAPNIDVGREIANIIVGSGLGLYEMRRTQASLEQVFLELTMSDPLIESDLESELASESTADAADRHPADSPEAIHSDAHSDS